MTTSKNNQTMDKKTSGNQGFASMPKEKVQEIARKGGEASHNSQASQGTQEKNSSKNTSSNKAHDSKEGNKGQGNQGFASMPKEKVQEIARKGGEASHGSKKDDDNTKGNRTIK